MLKIYFAIGIVIVACVAGVADLRVKSLNATIEKEINDVVAKQRELALKKDVALLRQILADDYLSTNAYGQVRMKDETVRLYEEQAIVYEALEVSEMRILILSPTSAVANFKVSTKEMNKGQDESGAFRVTRVFAKRQGRWQVVVNHSTSLAQ